MDSSVKRTLVLILGVSAVYGGFWGGRALGGDLNTPRNVGPKEISGLVAAKANGAMGDPGRQESDSNVPPGKIFKDVLEYVEHDYVEGASNKTKLSNGALARMFASLDDPKTDFLEPAVRKNRQAALQGHFTGIGVVLTVAKVKKADVDSRLITVVDVMPGSPAERAGLRSGDVITEMDGRWIMAYSIMVEARRIQKMSATDAVKKNEAEKVNKRFETAYTISKALTDLTTGENRALKLTVERAGQALPPIAVTTAVTKVDPVEYRVVGNHIGYLRVHQFNPTATKDFQTALSKLEEGAKGLILDLRGNPGGVRADVESGVDGYDSALRLISLLTPGGVVGNLERRPNQSEPLTVKAVDKSLNLPLVVLVDKGTANLSELVASALHDKSKAKLVGAHTFGDPVLQRFVILQTGAGVEMSTAHLQTAAGIDLSKGLNPDIAANGGNAGEDVALQRALAALGA